MSIVLFYWFCSVSSFLRTEKLLFLQSGKEVPPGEKTKQNTVQPFENKCKISNRVLP